MEESNRSADDANSIGADLHVSHGGGTQRAQDAGASNDMSAWGHDTASRLRAAVNEVRRTERKTLVWSDLQAWALFEQRLNPRTFAQRRRDLVRMTKHPFASLEVSGTADEIVASFCDHVRYRECVEDKAPTAIVNDHKAGRMLLAFYGIDTRGLPKPPPVVKKARELLPTPEEIHALMHTDYIERNAARSYENALVKHLLAFSFGLGVRPPSEIHALKLAWYRPREHLLIVQEPKKGGPTRTLMIEPEWMCCSPRLLSLANYLRWRDKVDPNREQEAFFLRPDGKPFASKTMLRQFLVDHVKPSFPWFHPYLARHWCATARLVEWDFDYVRVADWLGHESVERLRRYYDHDARIAAKLYGKQWLRRAFLGNRQASSPRPSAMDLKHPTERPSDAPVGI